MSATRSCTTATWSTSCEAQGAVFVEELDEVPEDGLVVFSAHGVPKAVPAEARRRRLLFADATCPLVSKVHREVERHHKAGRTVLLIGHAGHPEVIGTMGQVAAGLGAAGRERGRRRDGRRARSRPGSPTRRRPRCRSTTRPRIVAVLRRRFPAIQGPRNEDICYATTNRQTAVEAIAPRAELFLVVGAANSSNSMRLVEVARQAAPPVRAAGARRRRHRLGLARRGPRRSGCPAGASAPELLVEQLVAACRERCAVTVEEVRVAEETVTFRSPPIPLARRAS